MGNWSRLKTDISGVPMRVEEELKTYLQVLWRYKWMIAACAIIASMVALGISYLLTPLYSAMATLRVASAPGGASDYISTRHDHSIKQYAMSKSRPAIPAWMRLQNDSD